MDLKQQIENFVQDNEEIIMEAVARDDNEGFCVNCSAEAYGVEPDAEKYACEVCRERAVFGAEQLLFYMV